MKGSCAWESEEGIIVYGPTSRAASRSIKKKKKKRTKIAVLPISISISDWDTF